MMQNGLGESFWDAHGVEIGPCAIFEHFAPSGKIDGTGNKNDRIDSLGSWAAGARSRAAGGAPAINGPVR